MAISFTESDIEEFRDCFSLYTRDKHINSDEQLTVIMRSLAFSPTTTEAVKYFSENQKDSGKADSIVNAVQKALSKHGFTPEFLSQNLIGVCSDGASVMIDRKSDGRIDFATFINILEKHSKQEKCQNDIVAAFKAHDRTGQGTVSTADLHYVLTHFGDKMTNAEVEKLFRDANVQSRGQVNHEDIVRALLTSMPDY